MAHFNSDKHSRHLTWRTAQDFIEDISSCLAFIVVTKCVSCQELKPQENLVI